MVEMYPFPLAAPQPSSASTLVGISVFVDLVGKGRPLRRSHSAGFVWKGASDECQLEAPVRHLEHPVLQSSLAVLRVPDSISNLRIVSSLLLQRLLLHLFAVQRPSSAALDGAYGPSFFDHL